MNSRKIWDITMLILFTSFICFVIYTKLDGFMEVDQKEAVNSDYLINSSVSMENIDKIEDSLPIFYISEPFISEEETAEMADLVVIGKISEIKIERVSASSSAPTKFILPYILYDIRIIDSIKNPKNVESLKVKCIYGKTNGFDPTNIKLGELYKLYLMRTKDESFVFANYRFGIQEFKDQ